MPVLRFRFDLIRRYIELLSCRLTMTRLRVESLGRTAGAITKKLMDADNVFASYGAEIHLLFIFTHFIMIHKTRGGAAW